MENVEVLLESKEVEKFKGEGTEIESAAVALEVKDEISRAQMSDMRERARQFKKSVQAWFKESKEAADLAHTKICDLEKKTFGPADRVIKIADGKMNQYLLEEDRKHQEAQAKIDAETKRREDAERERLLKLAVKQADNGKTEKAEETLQKAEDVYIPPTVLPPSLDKTVKTEAGGTSSRKDFDIVVENPDMFIKMVVLGGGNYGFIEFKGGPIKRYAEGKRIGNNLPVIPGCRITPKYGFAGRSR